MMTSSKTMILGVIGIILVVLGLFYFVRNNNTAMTIEGWKTQTDNDLKVQFMYPETIDKKYISTVNWPPLIGVSADKFECTETDEDEAPGGQISTERINGKRYCITEVSEGAAGSTYKQYAYESEIDNKTVTLNFTLRYPQCANYEESTKAECEDEQESFELNDLVDQIFRTVKLNQ